MQNIKTKADELALMKSPVNIEDLTIKILNDLDEEYKELANAIQAREMAISFSELHEKLLQKHNLPPDNQITFPATATLQSLHH